MNKSLQKDIITDEMRQKKKRAYCKKHMTKCQTMCVTLRNEQDADIIKWLSEQDNRSEAVRKVLRQWITE